MSNVANKLSLSVVLCDGFFCFKLFEINSINPTMWVEALPADKQPSACISCGKCTKICPQGIDIPDVMGSLSQKLERLPKWRQICLEREETAKRVKNY